MRVAGDSPADLTHVDTWLFDLDNTLYPLDSGLALEVDRRIRDFVIRATGLGPDEAYALQKRYLAEHGLSLTGLVKHHGVDPADFHAIFEDLPLEMLAQDPDLVAALKRLPGRRLIFTNADEGHARRVADRLGLASLFDDIFHIGSADLEPKPSMGAFEKIIAAHAIEPATTAFFEDAERNLKPAAELGMTTVLVGAHAADSIADFVHHRTWRLAPFLAAARVKEAP